MQTIKLITQDTGTQFIYALFYIKLAEHYNNLNSLLYLVSFSFNCVALKAIRLLTNCFRDKWNISSSEISLHN